MYIAKNRGVITMRKRILSISSVVLTLISPAAFSAGMQEIDLNQGMDTKILVSAIKGEVFANTSGMPGVSEPKQDVSTSHKTGTHNSTLFTAGEFLKDVPADIREEFLDSFVFKDGIVVSCAIGKLNKSVNGQRLNDILKAFSTYVGAGDNIFDSSSPLVSVADLLKGVSPSAKTAFLNGMMFKGSTIVSMRTKELEEAVGNDMETEIISRLIGGQTFRSKEVCASGSDGVLYCESDPFETCPAGCR